MLTLSSAHCQLTASVQMGSGSKSFLSPQGQAPVTGVLLCQYPPPLRGTTAETTNSSLAGPVASSGSYPGLSSVGKLGANAEQSGPGIGSLPALGASELTHPPEMKQKKFFSLPPPIPAPAPREGPQLCIRCSLEDRAGSGLLHGYRSCVCKIIETQKPAPRPRAESWCVPTLQPSFSLHPQPKPPPIRPS